MHDGGGRAGLAWIFRNGIGPARENESFCFDFCMHPKWPPLGSFDYVFVLVNDTSEACFVVGG